MPDDFIQDSLNQGRERVDEALDYYDNLALQDRPDREKERLGSLRTALAASDGMTAQGQAEARRLADSLGMPQKVVAAAPERAREEVVFRRLSQDELLARWAAQDKENAALAREDADGLLTVFERVKDVGRAFTHGAADLNRAGLGAVQAVTENLFGADSAAARWLQERQKWVEWARPQEVKVDSTVGQFAYDFVRSAPQQLLNIATALANPGAALYMMGTQILGGSYSELREQGVSPRRALESGLANAALQAPLERLGLDRFMAVFRSTSLRDTLMRMGGAALAEGFTEYLQKAPETLTNLWGLAETKFKNQDDQIAWFANTFFDAQTLATMHREALYEGAIGAMWGLVGGGARTLASRQARQRAQVFVEEQEVIQDAVQGAQTKALSPEKMEEALEAAAVTSDGSSVLAQSVYIPPQAALDLMNQGTDILTPLGITVEEAQDAAAKDVDLEVKQSALQARLDVDQVSEVLQIMRETPNAPSLMDVLGSQDIEAEEMLAAVEEAKSRKRKLDAVRKEEMRLIGEMTPLMGNQVAQQQARLLVAHANAAAQSYGVDPATVLGRYHVKRGSEGAANAVGGVSAGTAPVANAAQTGNVAPSAPAAPATDVSVVPADVAAGGVVAPQVGAGDTGNVATDGASADALQTSQSEQGEQGEQVPAGPVAGAPEVQMSPIGQRIVQEGIPAGTDIDTLFEPAAVDMESNPRAEDLFRDDIVFQGSSEGAPVRAQADLATGVIRLFRGADLSSLSHESAHLFVQELDQIAQDDGSIARERLRSDLEQAQIDGAPFAGLLDGTMNTADARAMLRDVRSELAELDERVQRVRDQLKEARVNAHKQARRQIPEDQREAAAVRNDQEMAQAALEGLVRIQEMDAQDRRRLLASERLLAQYVRNMDGLEQAREDMRTLRRFAGVPEEGPLSDDQYRDMQEYAARGFEQYVSEGRAPSAELEGFFSRMMRWLKNLYASWRSYVGAELSDDVRRVYDRMLSADVQAQTDPDIDAMLGREEDFLLETDLTDDERSYLEDLRTRAGAEATAKMDRAALRERNRRYREAYTSAREILKEDPFWVSVFEFTRQRGKKSDTNGVNKESLAEYLGEEQASELAKKMPMLVNAKNTGFPVDTMAQFAESHGYGDGDADAMANKLYERLVLDGQTFNKACQEFAEAQLAQEDARDIPSEEVLAGDSYGQYLEEMENALHRMDQELSEEGELKHLRRTTREQADRLDRLERRLGRQIESQARKAERQIESLQGRLGRQTEELRERRKTGRELAARNRTLERHETVRERARRLERRAIPESWYRSLARKEVAELPINKLGNGRFVASLRRALSERSRAARRGDYVAAAKAMQRARYAFAMMQEAKRARDEVARIEKRMRRAARVKNGTYPAVQTEALRKLGEALGLIDPRAPWDAEAAGMSFRNLVAQAAGDTTAIDVMPMFANWVLDLQSPDVLAAAKGKALVWRELNLMEAQEVGNVLDFLVHSAREQSRTNKESLRAQVEEIAGKAAQAMESLPTYYAPARDTPKDRIMKGWTSIDTIDWECRKADGFQHVPGRKDSTAGPMETEVYGRLRKSMDAYHDRLNGTYKGMAPHVVHLLESAKALEQKYGKKTLKVRDENGRLVRIPDALVRDGQKGWTADQLFAMALNLGNAGNRERLRESFKNEKGEDGLDFNLVSLLLGDDAAATLFEMSAAQRAEAMQGRAAREGLLSEQDWLAIQGIWDVLGTQWPDTQAAHKKLYGFAPQGVELEPLTIRVGGRPLELKGGYYPIRYDRRLDLKTRELGSTEDIMDRTEGLIGVPPSAKKGHTMKRADHTGRSLLLDVASVLQRHLIDSARFIELGYDVRFADRVIQSASFASQYQRAFGIHDYDRIRPNLKGLVVDEVAPQDELFQFAELLRKHLTYYALGGNVKVAAMQLTAIWPAAGDIGYGEVLGGLGQLMTRGTGLVRDVWAASPYMERRYRNIDEDLSRKAMDFKPGRLSVIRNGRVYTWDDLANLSMLPIAVADTVVTTAIWTGAYHKRLSELQKKSAAWKVDLESEYHADAVAYADSVIAQSNPDNDALSKSAFARSKGVARLFNAFSGATTKFAQRTRYAYQGWRAGRITGKEFARMEAHDMLLPALSMVFMLGLAQGLMSGDDEDTEELLKLLGSTTLGQAAMAVPIFGNPCADALTALFGAGTRRAGLSTALNTPFEMAGRSAAAWSDLDGQKMFTTTLDIASYVTRVPVGPAARRTVRGVEQWQEGEGTPFSVFMPRSGQ